MNRTAHTTEISKSRLMADTIFLSVWVAGLSARLEAGVIEAQSGAVDWKMSDYRRLCCHTVKAQPSGLIMATRQCERKIQQTPHAC
jgi:hypothetical protein